MVDVGTGGQAGQIDVAVEVGQVGEARGVAGDMDAAAADAARGAVRMYSWCGGSTVSDARMDALARGTVQDRPLRTASPSGGCTSGVAGRWRPMWLDPSEAMGRPPHREYAVRA